MVTKTFVTKPQAENLVQKRIWLRDRDSNPNFLIQSQTCYLYTIPEKSLPTYVSANSVTISANNITLYNLVEELFRTQRVDQQSLLNDLPGRYEIEFTFGRGGCQLPHNPEAIDAFTDHRLLLSRSCRDAGLRG